MTKLTLAELEAAITQGRVEVAMRSGRWWRCRRNGKTQTWKTRPNEFSIPIKAGMNAYGKIKEGDLEAGFIRILPNTTARIVIDATGTPDRRSNFPSAV